MSEQPKSLLEAAKDIYAALEHHGEWDDGCFYFNHHAAPELQKPLRELDKAIKVHEDASTLPPGYMDQVHDRIAKAEDEIKSQEAVDEPDTFSIGVKAMEEFAAPWPEVEPDANRSGEGEAVTGPVDLIAESDRTIVAAVEAQICPCCGSGDLRKTHDDHGQLNWLQCNNRECRFYWSSLMTSSGVKCSIERSAGYWGRKHR